MFHDLKEVFIMCCN